jgi:hypothetical protein
VAGVVFLVEEAYTQQQGHVCVGLKPIWPGSLGRQATWSGASKAAGIPPCLAAALRRRRRRRRGGGGGEGVNGDSGIFTPLAANCSDVMSCLDCGF